MVCMNGQSCRVFALGAAASPAAQLLSPLCVHRFPRSPARATTVLLHSPAPYTLTPVCADRWIKDDLGVPSFARLGDLVVVPVAAFDGRYDIWTIDAGLSSGCGSPELPEEVML